MTKVIVRVPVTVRVIRTIAVRTVVTVRRVR